MITLAIIIIVIVGFTKLFTWIQEERRKIDREIWELEIQLKRSEDELRELTK